MWEPQLLETLRASTTCTVITLPFTYYDQGKHEVIPVFNVMYNLALCHGGIWVSGDLALPLLMSALDGGVWLASSPSRYNPENIAPVPTG
jgi:hypothetical protein